MNGSEENKPKRQDDKPIQKGVPDLRDFMNQSNAANDKDAVDIQSLMNEIRRVPSSRMAKPQPINPAQQPQQARPTQQPQQPQQARPAQQPQQTQKPAAPKPASQPVSKPAPQAAPQPAPSVKAAPAAPLRPGSQVRYERPEVDDDDDDEETPVQVRRSQISSARRKQIEARRRRAVIIIIVTFVLILLAVGLGIYYLVTHLTSKSGETQTTSATTVTTSSETTPVSEESETTTSETTEPEATPTPAVTPFPAGGPSLTGYCVVIDPGHQAVANTDPESMSSSMGGSKDRSSQGYTGVVTGTDESEINLENALLLKEYLESLGCEVYLTRETNDVDISNKERAEFAVSKNPDLFIRLYCNAANDSKTNGIEVIVPNSGEYASQVPTWGENLGKQLSTSTGSAFNGCKASEKYSGLNWANSVPSFMIRMGYLTNSDDEANLMNEEYQFKLCQGIAQFIVTMPQH
ncbi:MAG: N-acetylmuramoyl-L-alanine amidase [Clostridiales bacterium]|nr:N-acetylmuramoyl-L-alanine amidase [Clostridiales bacterium]